jgi:hypothetical protein
LTISEIADNISVGGNRVNRAKVSIEIGQKSYSKTEVTKGGPPRIWDNI